LNTLTRPKPSTSKRDLELALTIDDLRAGKGSVRQRAAFEEWEWRRCAESPAYFLDHYGHIILKDGSVQKWRLWPVQYELLEEWLSGKSTVAVKARQLGITTLSSHYALWEILFKEAVRWYAVSKSEESAKDLLSRVSVTKDRLPRWMVERAVRRSGENLGTAKKDSSDGAVRIAFGLSSLSVLTSTPKSVQGKAGKFILDEFAAHENQKRIWNLVLPAFDGGGQCVMIANGEGENVFYHIYQAAKRGDNSFVPHFFSWRDDPSRDEEWYERTKKSYMLDNPEVDEFDFVAQYPSTEDEAFFITGNSRFDLRVVNAIAKEQRKAQRPEVGFLEADGTFMVNHHVGKMRVWERPLAGARYTAGIDSSGGKATGDYATCVVSKYFRDEEGHLVIEQVCEYQAKVEPDVLSLHSERICRWYNDAFCVIERNNHGGVVVSRMKESYYNLYIQKRPDLFTEEQVDNFGYPENKRTKAELIDRFAGLLNGYGHMLMDGEGADRFIVRSETMLTEISRYEVRDNGGTGAPKGSNDDLLIGGALSCIGAFDRAMYERTERSRVIPASDW